MFKRLEGDTAIIRKKGVFQQTDLYEWDGALFVKAAGGFIRLHNNGRPSHPDIVLEVVHTERPLFQGAFGRVFLTDGEGRKPLALSSDGVLNQAPLALSNEVGK